MTTALNKTDIIAVVIWGYFWGAVSVLKAYCSRTQAVLRI